MGKKKIPITTDKEYLCATIQKYHCIYDKSDKNYKNNNAKQNVWNAIRESFKENGMNECSDESLKATWKNIIDIRRAYRRASIQKSGSGRNKLESWSLYDQTSFLDNYLDDVKTTTNLKPKEHGDNLSEDNCEGRMIDDDLESLEVIEDVSVTEDSLSETQASASNEDNLSATQGSASNEEPSVEPKKCSTPRFKTIQGQNKDQFK